MEFGPYKVVRTLATGTYAKVHLASRSGGGAADAKFVIKVCSVTAADDLSTGWHGGMSGEEAALHKADFAAAVTRQKRAFANAPDCVAPVHEGELSAEHVWFATDYYPHSVERLIEGMVKVNPETMHRIVAAVVRAALAYKAAGAAHGNLKPANILLGAGRFRLAVIDPAPVREHDPAHLEREDLHAIGDLIYQMVRRKSLSGRDHWPIDLNADWNAALGNAAPRWLVLCNELLDPNVNLETLNLEVLQRRLTALKPRGAGLFIKAGAIAGAVALLAVGGWWVFTLLNDPVKKAFNAAEAACKDGRFDEAAATAAKHTNSKRGAEFQAIIQKADLARQFTARFAEQADPARFTLDKANQLRTDWAAAENAGNCCGLKNLRASSDQLAAFIKAREAELGNKENQLLASITADLANGRYPQVISASNTVYPQLQSDANRATLQTLVKDAVDAQKALADFRDRNKPSATPEQLKSLRDDLAASRFKDHPDFKTLAAAVSQSAQSAEVKAIFASAQPRLTNETAYAAGLAALAPFLADAAQGDTARALLTSAAQKWFNDAKAISGQDLVRATNLCLIASNFFHALGDAPQIAEVQRNLKIWFDASKDEISVKDTFAAAKSALHEGGDIAEAGRLLGAMRGKKGVLPKHISDLEDDIRVFGDARTAFDRGEYALAGNKLQTLKWNAAGNLARTNESERTLWKKIAAEFDEDKFSALTNTQYAGLLRKFAHTKDVNSARDIQKTLQDLTTLQTVNNLASLESALQRLDIATLKRPGFAAIRTAWSATSASFSNTLDRAEKATTLQAKLTGYEDARKIWPTWPDATARITAVQTQIGNETKWQRVETDFADQWKSMATANGPLTDVTPLTQVLNRETTFPADRKKPLSDAVEQYGKAWGLLANCDFTGATAATKTRPGASTPEAAAFTALRGWIGTWQTNHQRWSNDVAAGGTLILQQLKVADPAAAWPCLRDLRAEATSQAALLQRFSKYTNDYKPGNESYGNLRDEWRQPANATFIARAAFAPYKTWLAENDPVKMYEDELFDLAAPLLGGGPLAKLVTDRPMDRWRGQEVLLFTRRNKWIDDNKPRIQILMKALDDNARAAGKPDWRPALRKKIENEGFEKQFN
jgi:hypothetical protein